jgi:hypothetical protein
VRKGSQLKNRLLDLSAGLNRLGFPITSSAIIEGDCNDYRSAPFRYNVD